MHSNINKIIKELSGIGNFSKKLIKHGIRIFLGFFALGTLLVVLNRVSFGYDSYIEFVAQNIIKNSFIMLAEFIIGGLLIDFILNRK